MHARPAEVSINVFAADFEPINRIVSADGPTNTKPASAQAAAKSGAPFIELHTGAYADARGEAEIARRLQATSPSGEYPNRVLPSASRLSWNSITTTA